MLCAFACLLRLCEKLSQRRVSRRDAKDTQRRKEIYAPLFLTIAHGLQLESFPCVI